MDDDFLANWTVQARKGVLELCILNALRDEERYGYELVKSLAAVPGLDVPEGTIYPLLSRLRQQGLLSTRLEESPSGPARRFYGLTPGGQARRRAMNDYFLTLAATVSQIASNGSPRLAESGAEGPPPARRAAR